MTDQHNAGSVEEWLDNLDDVDPSAARDGQHMRRIVAARDALGAATAELHEAMTAARRAGDSWAIVGTALGISRQAAESQFGELVDANAEAHRPRRQDGDQRTGELDTADGPRRYLNLGQVEQRLGLGRGALSTAKMPTADVVVGPVNEDGTLPRGTARGWRPETIDEWAATRPGRGARTDLRS